MNLKLMSILSGKGFVMYNKELAHKVSANGAIIFGQLCSSYESFGSKGMLTVRGEKEYFFLTIETLEEETALSYKQQMKAVKELEKAGYIETRNMGVPQKRHFHITDKIVNELLSSSDKREELNTPTNSGSLPSSSSPSLDQRETLELPKGDDNNCQKVSNIKKKNKKEKDKNNNEINIVNKEDVNKDEIINKLVLEFMKKGLNKEVGLRVANEVIQKDDIENFGGYLRSCLKTTLYRVKVKTGEIDPSARMREVYEKQGLPYFDWLNASREELETNWIDDDELPY